MKDLFDKMKKLNENKNSNVVTFDFDNTIVKSYEESNDGEETIYRYGGINKQIIARIKRFRQAGTTVLVVTSRTQALEVPESSIRSMLDELNLKVDGVFYTNGEKKAKKLYELGSSLHYDDDPAEREAIVAYKKLHPSDIVVKDPDELLKDTNEISKGIILTTDGKIIIGQRSDSLEWDAPGGHIMEGEEANFSFYREVLEELSLKVKKIKYIDSLETVWKKKEQLVHYFVGHVPYTSEELEGVIKLQWEVADYFCGDLDEIEEKVNESSTQNLKNVMNLINSESILAERAYPHSTNHSKKKRRLIGLGNSKSTGAVGLKKVKVFKRSKSAPAGFGVLEEEENNIRTIKISIKSSIEEKKKRRKKRKRKKSKWPYGDFNIGSVPGSGNDGDGGGDGG